MSQAFTPKSIQYDSQTMQRARVAFVCSPFRWQLLAGMRDRSISLAEISGKDGVAANYTEKAIAELTAEHYTMWLIQVGILRREVDGQGLTDSFRLTPLGRQILEDWQQREDLAAISLMERLSNNFRCWFSRFSP